MKRVILFCSIAMFLLGASLSQAQPPQQGGKIRFGNLAIIPGVTVQGIYDDNIYLKNGKDYPEDPQKTLANKKESDWVTHAKPSLLLSYTMPERGLINLGYQGDFAFYKSNTSNNWKNSQGIFSVDYTAPGGLILGINEHYVKAEDPFGGADQYQIGSIKKRYYNDLTTKLGFLFSENFRTLLYFNHYKQKYDNSLLDYSQDYTIMEYGAGAEARVLPKTWTFLRYLYGTQKYDTNAPGQTDAFNSNAKWHRVSAGLTWDPGAKLSGEVNVGYQWRRYDHQFTSALQTARRDDKDTWVAATSLTYMPTEATTLNLSLSRAIRSTASDTSEQFTDTAVGLNLSQKLLMKLTLKAGFTYSRNEYNLPVGSERADNNYLANLGLDYDIRDWLSFGVGYNLNRKNSNIEINEYISNQYVAQVKIVY